MTDPYQQQPYGQQPQDGQPYGQPQYGQPQYGQPQYGVPGTGPGQPYGMPGQPQFPGQYAQPGMAPAGFDPSAPYGRNAFGEPYSDKSKLVAGLLQIFLGSFGVGRFYLGHNGIAIAQLAISLVTCFTLGWIWPLIDGILILTGKVPDSNGLPLQES